MRGLNTMQRQTTGLTSAVRKLGTVIGAAFAVRQIIAFGKECAALGSNVQEVQNVVDTAFGDMSYKVDEFANTSIRRFGMSRLAAKKTAGTYMAMAKGMGIADEAASDMAISLAGLTGDVASFFNISQELADVKLKSVFTGETETLKDLGVVMTQANLKAYALKKGITKNIEAMTQAELVSLRYNFVLDQLALANGDFAKTANNWANQTRVLSMQWQELMSIIGQSVIKIFTPLVRVLNQIVSAMISAAQTASAFISGLFGGADAQMAATGSAAASVASEIGASVDNQDALTDATKATAKAQKGLLAGFDEITKLSDGSEGSGSSGSTTGLSVGAIQAPAINLETTNAEILGFGESIKAAFDEFMGQIDWERLRTSAEGLRETLARLGSIAFDALERLWVNVLQPLGVWVLNTAAPVFLDGLNEGLDLLADLAEVLMGEKSIGELVGELTPLQTVLLGLASALLAISIAQGVATTFTAITTFISTVRKLGAAGIIGKLAEVIMLTASGAGTLHEAMQLVFGPGSIIAGIAAIIGGAIMAVSNFINMLENGFDWVHEALMLVGIAIAAVGAIILGAPALVAGVIAAIVAAVATAVVVIKEHWATIADWFNSHVIKPIAAFFGSLWNGIKTGASVLASFFRDKVITPIVNAFKGFYNSVVRILEGVVNGFIGIINKFIGGINGAINTINLIPGVSLPSLKRMPTVSIPRLAAGAVIPPNSEFLAVLGDQKSGNNIETPEALLRKIVREESGSGTSDYLLREILQAIREGHVIAVDGKILAQVLNKRRSNDARAYGV